MSRAQDYRDAMKGKDDAYATTIAPLILCDILEVLMEIDMRLTRKFDGERVEVEPVDGINTFYKCTVCSCDLKADMTIMGTKCKGCGLKE